jgi:predicted enzyme related to lactoylglutathione lyase
LFSVYTWGEKMTKRDIVHIDIPAANRHTSAKFYADLFGWGVQHYEEMRYSTFQAGNVNGGYPDLSENRKAGEVIVYIDSTDIAADLKKIEAAGGKVVLPKTDIPGWGSYALFNDPAGNTLALWTSASG